MADWLKKWMACRATDPLSRLVAAALKVSDPSPHPTGHDRPKGGRRDNENQEVRLRAQHLRAQVVHLPGALPPGHRALFFGELAALGVGACLGPWSAVGRSLSRQGGCCSRLAPGLDRVVETWRWVATAAAAETKDSLPAGRGSVLWGGPPPPPPRGKAVD